MNLMLITNQKPIVDTRRERSLSITLKSVVKS